jgi:hypothetical protein
MKKTLLAISLLASLATADACCYRGYYHHGYYGGSGWVAPALIGGVIGYELARPPEVVVQQPVYVQPPVVVQQPPVPPAGYHYLSIQDPACNCYKMALVPN